LRVRFREAQQCNRLRAVDGAVTCGRYSHFPIELNRIWLQIRLEMAVDP